MVNSEKNVVSGEKLTMGEKNAENSGLVMVAQTGRPAFSRGATVGMGNMGQRPGWTGFWLAIVGVR